VDKNNGRKRRLEAFVMWCYRRNKKISWMVRVTNVEVLERISDGKLLWNNIVRRRNEWIGYIMRHDGLLKMIIEGKLEGKNRRGSQILEFIQQIIKDQECDSYFEMKRKADKKEEWRMAANQTTN